MWVRTSNNDQNDDPTIFWQSNYGAFDPVQSFTVDHVFLMSFIEVTFDLTQIPTFPNQPWQGNIDAIRLDPVIRFLQAGLPVDGWFEIDRIALY
jgi:hypothetical protein